MDEMILQELRLAPTTFLNATLNRFLDSSVNTGDCFTNVVMVEIMSSYRSACSASFASLRSFASGMRVICEASCKNVED
jgi:hypothetical protein